MPSWTSQALAFLLGDDNDALLAASPARVAAPEGAGEVVASLMPPTDAGDGEVGLAVDILRHRLGEGGLGTGWFACLSRRQEGGRGTGHARACVDGLCVWVVCGCVVSCDAY